MGWVWRDETDDAYGSSGGDVIDPSGGSDGDQCSTRKVVRSQCKTEEVEPGKFIRKCEKTEEILRDCIGKPVEVLQSNKEFTEEDVTDQVLRGSSHPRQFEEGPFNFPGLRSDIEAIERDFFGGIKSFFDVAEEMKNSFFEVFSDMRPRERPSTRRGIPIESSPRKEPSAKPKEPNSGHVDLSGLARDV